MAPHSTRHLRSSRTACKKVKGSPVLSWIVSGLDFGSITFAIFILPLLALDILGGWTSEHPFWGYLLLLGALFVAPAGLPIVWRRLLDTELVKGHVVNPIPKPWDYVFGKGDTYWVILHMKDGRLIGGRYETESFASSFPQEEQLYLEEVWKLSDEGAFESKIDRTAGILVSYVDVYAIELFRGS